MAHAWFPALGFHALSFAVAACTGPSTPMMEPAAPAHVAQPAPSPAIEAGDTSALPAPEGPLGPEPVASAGCTINLGSGTLRNSLPLQIENHSLGRISGEVESLTLRIAPDAKRASVEMTTPYVRLSADVDPEWLRVGQKVNVPPVRGWIELISVRVKRAQGGRADVEVRFPGTFRPAHPVMEASVPCDELTLYLPRPARPFPNESLKRNTQVKVSIGATGSMVVGTLYATKRRPGAATLIPMLSLLSVQERRKRRARVRLAGEATAVVGWIDAKAIDPKAGMAGVLGMLSGGSASNPRLRCSQDVPLRSRLGDRVFEIGVVRAGASLGASKRSDGGYDIELDTGGLAGLFGANPPRKSRPASAPYIPFDHAAHCAEEKTDANR